MGRGRNLHEFEAAVERLQIPMFNVIYADKDGHIMLVCNGNSSDPKSPHFGDQLALSANKQMRDAWLTRAEVEQHLERTTVFDRHKITSNPPLN